MGTPENRMNQDLTHRDEPSQPSNVLLVNCVTAGDTIQRDGNTNCRTTGTTILAGSNDEKLKP